MNGSCGGAPTDRPNRLERCVDGLVSIQSRSQVVTRQPRYPSVNAASRNVPVAQRTEQPPSNCPAQPDVLACVATGPNRPPLVAQ